MIAIAYGLLVVIMVMAAAAGFLLGLIAGKRIRR